MAFNGDLKRLPTPRKGGFAWARFGPEAKNSWASLGQRLGQNWAKGIQHSEIASNSRSLQAKRAKNVANTLFLFAKTALQRQLRMVCVFRSPKRAKQAESSVSASPLKSRPFHFGRAFGTATAVLLLALSPVMAQGWQNAATSSGWSSQDRFKAETPRTNNRAPSQSFNVFLSSLKGGELDKLMSLISRVESPRLGYDSVQYRARVKPPRRPTEMTLGGIFTWIKKTPGQQHAIGRYQVIPKTLAYVSRELGFKASTKYNRNTQDKIATFLIMEAGYDAFRKGRISRSKFMDNLAAVWAGFPLRNGKSKYAGIAGNKATISRAQFERVMAEIFPVRRAQG